MYAWNIDIKRNASPGGTCIRDTCAGNGFSSKKDFITGTSMEGADIDGTSTEDISIGSTFTRGAYTKDVCTNRICAWSAYTWGASAEGICTGVTIVKNSCIKRAGVRDTCIVNCVC